MPTNTITTRKPPIILTVGGLYICFDASATAGEYSGAYESEVIRLETVKTIQVQEELTSQPVRASGKVYKTVEQLAGVNMQTSQIAFPGEILAKMRGDIVGSDGVVVSVDNPKRPYFAIGYATEYDTGVELVWYPKCKLSENSASLSTSEQNFSETPLTVNFRADTYSDHKVCTKVPADMESSWTEETWFAAPVVSAASGSTTNP